MIIVSANTLHHDGITIPEDVVIRTVQIDNGGKDVVKEVNGVQIDYIEVVMRYKAYLKSKYDVAGISAPTISIDELDDYIVTYIPKDYSMGNIAVFQQLYLVFNEFFKQEMVARGIPETAITIQ